MNSADPQSAVAAVPAPTPQPPKKKLTKLEMLERRVKEDPMVFGFLGLTVCALTGGMYSLMSNNKKQSQMMMRARVFFQFCTISALVGGIYYRAYQGTLQSQPSKPTTDNRVFLTDTKAGILDAPRSAASSSSVQLPSDLPALAPVETAQLR